MTKFLTSYIMDKIIVTIRLKWLGINAIKWNLIEIAHDIKQNWFYLFYLLIDWSLLIEIWITLIIKLINITIKYSFKMTYIWKTTYFLCYTYSKL